MVERQEFDDARQRLGAAGYLLRDGDASWQMFSRMRERYAARLNEMAKFWLSPPAQWIGDRSSIAGRHANRAAVAAPPQEPQAEAVARS